MSAPPARARHEERLARAAHVVRLAALAALAGAAAGLVVVGGGGLLLARVLGTTGPLGSTPLYLALSTALGVLTGLAYFAVRPALPDPVRARAALLATITGAVGGAVLLGDHGAYDVGRLPTPWPAVVAVVALLALAGAATAALTERWVRRGRRGGRRDATAAAVGVLALLMTFPVSVPLVVAGIVLAQARRLRRLATARVVSVASLVAVAVATAWGVHGLGADVAWIADHVPGARPAP